MSETIKDVLTLVGGCFAAIVTLYNLIAMRRLGIAEANKQLNTIQHEIAEAHEKQIQYWKGEHALCETRRAKQGKEIEALKTASEEQAVQIENAEKEVEGLKLLIAEQAIGHSYFLKAVLDNPKVQNELKKSWEQLNNIQALQALQDWTGPHERRSKPREADANEIYKRGTDDVND